MKHNIKITIILLAMFVVTQFIGLYVINFYSSHPLPYGLDTPSPQNPTEFTILFTQIIMAFIMAVFLIFFLAELKIEFLLKIWFFAVIAIALALFFNTIFPAIKYAVWISLGLGIVLSFIKIYKRDMIVHNITELMIYPGIASVFVPILNVTTVIIFLLIISIYDMWAVWRSGIMQKMAKYQMDNLKIFSGFFIPYLSKSMRSKIKKMKKSELAKLKKKGVKANVAILGGGDVVFPIITAGVMLLTYGFWYALFVIIGATLGLGYLFFFAKKKKFYPAMPFITTGILLGILMSYLVL